MRQGFLSESCFGFGDSGFVRFDESNLNFESRSPGKFDSEGSSEFERLGIDSASKWKFSKGDCGCNNSEETVEHELVVEHSEPADFEAVSDWKFSFENCEPENLDDRDCVVESECKSSFKRCGFDSFDDGDGYNSSRLEWELGMFEAVGECKSSFEGFELDKLNGSSKIGRELGEDDFDER